MRSAHPCTPGLLFLLFLSPFILFIPAHLLFSPTTYYLLPTTCRSTYYLPSGELVEVHPLRRDALVADDLAGRVDHARRAAEIHLDLGAVDVTVDDLGDQAGLAGPLVFQDLGVLPSGLPGIVPGPVRQRRSILQRQGISITIGNHYDQNEVPQR